MSNEELKEKLIQKIGEHWFKNINKYELDKFFNWARKTQCLTFDMHDLGNAFRGYVVGLGKANYQLEDIK